MSNSDEIRKSFESAREQLMLVESDYPAWQTAYVAGLDAMRDKAAKVCDERKSSHDSGLASCGKSKKEWSDFDLQEEISLEAELCARDIRSISTVCDRCFYLICKCEQA